MTSESFQTDGLSTSLRALQRLAEGADDASGMAAVAIVSDELVTLRSSVAVLTDENLVLTARLVSAQEAAVSRNLLSLRDGVYWSADDAPGSLALGPYCTRCFDIGGRMVLLIREPRGVRVFGGWRCPECGSPMGLAPQQV